MKLIFAKSVLFSLILLVGSSSLANFTGVWMGEGTVTTRDGREISCNQFVLNVTHGTDKMEFGRFSYGCDEFAFNFTPPVLTLGEKKIVSQDTFWKEEKVGKISSTRADLLFPLANNGKARYTVRKTSDNEMNYLDEQIGINAETGKEEITAIRAKLKRVE